MAVYRPACFWLPVNGSGWSRSHHSKVTSGESLGVAPVLCRVLTMIACVCVCVCVRVCLCMCVCVWVCVGGGGV